MVGLYQYTDVVALRTQTSQFSYTAPAGFSPWDAGGGGGGGGSVQPIINFMS